MRAVEKNDSSWRHDPFENSPRCLWKPVNHTHFSTALALKRAAGPQPPSVSQMCPSVSSAHSSPHGLQLFSLFRVAVYFSLLPTAKVLQIQNVSISFSRFLRWSKAWFGPWDQTSVCVATSDFWIEAGYLHVRADRLHGKRGIMVLNMVHSWKDKEKSVHQLAWLLVLFLWNPIGSHSLQRWSEISNYNPNRKCRLTGKLRKYSSHPKLKGSMTLLYKQFIAIPASV